MNIVSNKRQLFLKVFVVLLLLTYFVSASNVKDISALNSTSSLVTETAIDPVRQHMLDIAYLYAHHRWTATSTGTPAP